MRILLYSTILFCLTTAISIPADGAGIFAEIDGWTLSEEIQVFSPGNLFEYINGAAESYLDYNFKELQAGEYINKSGQSVIVEIYRHETSNHAFGIYSQERSSQGKYLETGAGGYVDPPILNFFKGAYYIKLSVYGQNGRTEEILIQMAARIAGGLGGTVKPPAITGCFPALNKIEYSETFIAKNFLGYSFLSNAFTADYDSDSGLFKLFIIAAETEGSCSKMIEEYLDYLKVKKKAPEGGRWELTDPYQGKIIMECQGNTIFGGIDESRYLKSELSKLKELLKDRNFIK